MLEALQSMVKLPTAALQGEFKSQQEILDAAMKVPYFPFLIFQQDIAGMMLTRFVSNVQQYFVMILAELMRQHPEAIDPKIVKSVQYSPRDRETKDQILQSKLEQWIEQLTYAGFDKLKKKIGQFGLPFEDNTGTFDKIVDERNIVVHNGWKVDASFAKKYPQAGLQEGDRLKLNLYDLFDRINPLLFIVAPMDDYVAANFPLIEKVNLKDHLRELYAERLNSLFQDSMSML
ncbi:MAG: hypothetical protein R3F28_12550 [Candidatus Kapaibacterium sp.]